MSNIAKTFVAVMADMYEKCEMSRKRCSVNEVLEKISITPFQLEVLLREEIIKGGLICGVPYIMEETPWSVRLKLEEWEKKTIEFMQEEIDEIKKGGLNE